MNYRHFRLVFRCFFLIVFLALVSLNASHVVLAQPIVPEFRTSRVFGGGGQISGGVVSDFNGDGKPDVLVTDVNNNCLRLFLGTGAGDFQLPAILISNVTAPQSMAAGDFNNDGHIDIAVVADDVMGNGDGVLVILGNGNGTFGMRVPYVIGFDPRTILADDFNGDGNLDFVVFENLDSNLKVYFGDGLGAHTLSSTIPAITGLFLTGDFNGDGKPEIIARKSTLTPITMLANNGNGTFAAPVAIPTGGMSSPNWIMAGHFNGDSNLDLYATDIFTSSNMLPLLGNGNNTFAAGALASYNTNLGHGTTGDFNRDQKTDLAMTNGSGRILIFNGNGNGTFATPASYGSGGGFSLVADLNRDNWPDIVSGVFNQSGGFGNFAAILNRRDGGFHVAPEYTFGGAVRDFTVGLLNTDQTPDIVSVSSPSVGTGQVLFALGTGPGKFGTTTARSVAIVPQAVVVADFNSDGINDVVAGGFADGGTQNLAFLAGTGTGLASPVLAALGAGISDILAIDLSGDGKKDLIVTTSTGVMTAISNGNGTFAAPNSYPTSAVMKEVTAGDFNGDGHVDLAAIKNQTAEVVLLLNNGSGIFSFGTSLNTAVFQMGIGSADLDGDTKTDIIVATDASGLYVFRGNGNGTFQTPSVIPAPSTVLDQVAIADFNQDGRPDVASNSFTAGAVVFTNNGSGALVEPRTWGTSKFPMALWAGDVDNDQWPDMLVGGFEPGNISIILNGRNTFEGSVACDFDGDGKTDLSIFRPNGAEWWINRSSNGSTFAAQFGATTDRITPGDFTGDVKADIAFFRPSSGEWYILRSEDFSFFAFPFGTNGDVPAPADYDGDGKTDAAVYRPSNNAWFIRRSTDGGATIEVFGSAGDVPVVADYDGDGKADMAIYRPSLGQWWIKRSSSSVIAFTFGESADKPVQGDYTGDGKSDVAFFRPSTSQWFILRSEDFSFYAVPFGTTGDIPSPGDYDGDGKFDTAVFRPSNVNWYVDRSTAGVLIQQFGSTGDVPVPNAYVP